MARSYERDLIDAVERWSSDGSLRDVVLLGALGTYRAARDADPAAVGKEGVDSVTGNRLTVVDDDGYVSAMLRDGTLGGIPARAIAPPPPDPITAYAEAHDLDPDTVRLILDAKERGEL